MLERKGSKTIEENSCEKIVINKVKNKKVLNNKQKYSLLKPCMDKMQTAIVNLSNVEFTNNLQTIKNLAEKFSEDPLSVMDFLNASGFLTE